MVPDVNKYAIRNGRGVAACVWLGAAIASAKAKNIAAKHHGALIVFFIAKNIVDLGEKCGGIIGRLPARDSRYRHDLTRRCVRSQREK